ncbi:hypothetical protein LY78DRAFT_750684 [Colletotrichum sublineola]|nr:hypothetical protein LY78DRAFT_750684 [Colletotrichum sublineola]
MPLDISALSEYQIQRFFQENDSVTQQQCNAEAQQITGHYVTPTACQGGSSYTVEGGEVVVQFRVPSSILDMDLLQSIEQAYCGFVPRHEYRGNLGQVSVYTMNNVGGTCMYLSRDELQRDNCSLLRFTIDDYARFFASAYHNTPIGMTRPDPTQLFDQYLSQLQQLREGLPERFHSTLVELISQLPNLFTDDWPLVPNHTDLFENNIHVDKATGRILGTMLGTFITTGDFWRYHPNHQELRDHFWNRFYYYLGGASDEQKRCIQAARLIGLFLANGFQQGRPATEESEDLRFLGVVILKR